MDRRSFLTTAVVGGTAAAGLAAPAIAQGKRTLTLVTTWARGFAGVHDSAQFCADKITEMTDGQLTVDLKAAGELVGALESFDAVTSGQADMYHAADYYFIDFFCDKQTNVTDSKAIDPAVCWQILIC